MIYISQLADSPEMLPLMTTTKIIVSDNLDFQSIGNLETCPI